jgi:hypothetical protein
LSAKFAIHFLFLFYLPAGGSRSQDLYTYITYATAHNYSSRDH